MSFQSAVSRETTKKSVSKHFQKNKITNIGSLVTSQAHPRSPTWYPYKKKKEKKKTLTF